MEAVKVYLAIDLGAESGRVIAGRYDGRRLQLDEVHRFDNTPLQEQGRLHWNIHALFDEVKKGISLAHLRYGDQIISMGVDTWAIDYGLLDQDGRLLNNPYHYRDRRTENILDKVFEIIPREPIYQATGIQFLEFNTLFQLFAETLDSRSKLRSAHHLLFIPDLINYWLTGRLVNERTNVGNSQMYDPVNGVWAKGLLEKLGVPANILGEIVDPCRRLGPLLSSIADETGAANVEVVLPATHDTASAVAAVPANLEDRAYLSSGTWSLLGVESPAPLINDTTLAMNLTNEIGVCGTFRLLKNISGLWLMQQCRRTWQEQGESLSYTALTQQAAQAAPFAATIDPDWPEFSQPGDLPAGIMAYCRRTGQSLPADKGAVIRTILESLALRYRAVFRDLEKILARRLESLHMVGGGIGNELLNQFTANALNREVIAGPVEATAAGNIMIQMMALGEIDSLAQGRELIARSFPTTAYQPQNVEKWDEAFQRYLRLPAV